MWWTIIIAVFVMIAAAVYLLIGKGQKRDRENPERKRPPDKPSLIEW